MTVTIDKHMSPAPIFINVELTMEDAAQRMFDAGIRHLPVMDGGHLVGLISERDIAMLDSLPDVERRRVTVGSAMTQNPYTCPPDAPLKDVVKTLAEHKIGTAVIMDQGKLVGIFSVIDALRLLARVLEAGVEV